MQAKALVTLISTRFMLDGKRQCLGDVQHVTATCTGSGEDNRVVLSLEYVEVAACNDDIDLRNDVERE